MKKLISSLAVALAGAALLHTSALAQDLVLGFQQSGNSNNVLLDVGDMSNYDALSAGTIIDLTAGASDLASFANGGLASGDLTNANLGGSGAIVFGAVASNGSGTALFATEVNPNASETVPPSATASNQASVLPNSWGNGTALNGGDTQYSASIVGQSYSKDAGLNGLWAGALQASQATVPTSTGYVTLDLMDIPASGVSGSQTEVGWFTLTYGATSDTLTFEAAPEPKAYVLMGLASLVMVVMLRRRMIES